MSLRLAIKQLPANLQEQARRKVRAQPRPTPVATTPKTRSMCHARRVQISTTTVLLAQLEQARIAGFEREHRFHPTRAWRFDIADPARRIALEVEGVTGGKGGRHQRYRGFVKDIEKYAEATCLGWRLLRVTPWMVRRGIALEYLKRMLAMT